MNNSGIVFNLQRFSVNDGPGIRTNVFLKGCPLSCLWCHNIESQRCVPEISYQPSRCIACGKCVGACANNCHVLINREHFYYREKCSQCGKCADDCSSLALELIGKKMTVEEVISSVNRDCEFFDNDGGVTITGGEPFAQAGFTIALAEAAHNNGLNVVIETSGYGKTEDFLEAAPFVNTFYFDCKADSSLHRQLTGVDDGLILKNLSALNESGSCIVLRCPIIPNVNLTETYIEKCIDLAKRYENIKAISILPYHKTGSMKWASIAQSPQQVFEIPSTDVIDQLRSIFEEKTGKKVF